MTTTTADPSSTSDADGEVRDAAPGTPPAASVAAPRGPLSVDPPAWLNRALDAAIVATKGLTIACAIDGYLNADTPRLRGKAIRTRAFGYTGALFIVPVIWRLLPDRGRYPRGLDLAITLPLLIDAGGNALGLYEEAHIDDAVHFLNAAILSGVAGALFASRTDEPWQAALAGTGAAITAETGWEIAEWVAMKAGADGMNLTYDDTMADLVESTLGAIAGGIVTWLRMPRAKADRRRGWRHAVAGWREGGEPMALLGGRGSVVGRAIGEAG